MKSEAVNSDQVTDGVREVKDDITAGIAECLGVGPSMANRKEYLIFLAASLLVSLGILSLLGYIYLWPLMEPYYALISDKEKISGLFRAAGNWAPIIYILLEAGQVLIMFWPVPLEIAGGFLFGLPLGLVYSMIGLTTGGVLAFLLGRWLERTYLSRMIDPEKLQGFQKLMKREGALAAFIIFLVPGVPKDFVSYVLGFTTLSLKFFVVAVAIFRLPSTFLLTLQGAEAAKGNYWLSVGLIGGNYVLAVLIYRYRDYLYQWIKAWHLEEL
ncbi:MAG: VTT domain-containing protein [Deltaproteobacteria bacterium]|nr:VTT domain-containing protein [Deltaproteobacteria bacterium]